MSEYYRIKEFSQLTSTTIKTLRYYDEIGLLTPSQKTVNGYRLYSKEDMLRLQQITILKFSSYPLNEIKSVLSHPDYDIKKSLKAQVQLLAKKEAVAKNAKWLIEETLTQLEQSSQLNWQMVANLIELVQLDENDKRGWQKNYYTPEEYNELAQVTLRHSPEFWQNNHAKWVALFKEVGDHLDTDPESDTGMYLAEKWLDLKNEVPMSQELQKKSWEAFQKGEMPQEVFAYDPRVIDYITKAIAKYKREKNSACIAETYLV